MISLLPQSPYALLARQAQDYPDHPLLILPEDVREMWGEPKSQWSYGETLAEVDRLAALYRAAGYGAGHRIALLLENRPDHYFHWLALNSLGISIVPVNPDYRDDELHYLLEHSESCLLVVLISRREQVRAVAEKLGVPLALASDDTLPPARQGHAAAEADPAEPGACEAAVIYTSGTTGRPKGCLLSNDYFMAWADWYTSQKGRISLQTGTERLMTPLPTFHVNAMANSFMGMLAAGGAQVIIDRFHPRSWWAMAIETKATCFHYLGVMPAILLELPAAPQDREHSLRFGFGGGVHPDHHAVFEERFGVPLLEGWAMTESGGAGLLCASAEPRHVGERCLGSVSRPGPQISVRIADDEGRDVPVGTPGELLIRAAGGKPGRGMFSGYLKNAVATSEIWQDGWLHTGDIMRLDPDGNLYFVDRKKNIIRRSGENIAAVEVEGAMSKSPAVKQAAVLAVLDPLRGEEVLSVVVLNTGVSKNEATAQEIFSSCAGQLAYYKLPAFMVFVDALPMTSTQKLRKQDLGDIAVNPMNAPHAFDFRERKQELRHAS